jgi:hypothetical protein
MTLPDHQPFISRADLFPLRLDAIDALVQAIEGLLAGQPADLGPRHLQKAAGSARSAVLLLRAGQWPDACILTRAVLEQLFSYLWVVQDPDLAEDREEMVTLKQEWANAQYLEGLAATAPDATREELALAAVAYREAATELLQRLTARLGLTEKQVRTQANAKVSAKANEVQVDPRFSIPFAHYSGFVHTDGTALAYFGQPLPAVPPVPVASDLHRALLQVLIEVAPRSGLDATALGEAHRTWLDAVDAKDPPWR